MIDTHAHLTDESYAGYGETIVSNMSKDNLDKIFTVSFDYKSCVDNMAFAKAHDNIYAILGVHPENCMEYDSKVEQYISQCGLDPKVVAIGEIGLDYHYTTQNKELQKQVFVSQIKLAHTLNLPIVIHVRDAMGEMIELLKQNKQYLTNGGVVHCFSGSVESFNEIKKLGFLIGLGGVLTFKNALNVVNVVSCMELSDFVLETDCPYLTPEPYRGKVKNEPKYILYVAKKIAEIKHITLDEVLLMANTNTLKLFTKAQ